MKIRARYTPSPTGRMHIGNLRTALYAYLVAKHADGTFILRIKNTDQGRFVKGTTEIIYHTLEGIGPLHDGGPDKDKDYGPCVQSEYMCVGIYMQYARQLAERGEAYYCFRDQVRLDPLREAVSGEVIIQYDKHCLSLSKEEIERRFVAGEPFVIRQNNPWTGTTTFRDEIYSDITVDNTKLDDMVLVKSDGFPIYNFASVVGDRLMEITHVVYGQECLSFSPKYDRLYEVFGWEAPIYVHRPIITNEQHRKLSRQSSHTSFEDLIEQDFVSEAVANFVALLGWPPEDDREIFSLGKLVRVFDYHRIPEPPVVFDITKLRWMDDEYFKAMASGKFHRHGEKYLKEHTTRPLDLRRIVEMVRTRVETFFDIREIVDLFSTVPDYETKLFVNKKSKSTANNSCEILTEVLPRLETLSDWNDDALFVLLKACGEEKGYKAGLVMWSPHIALSDKLMTPVNATEATGVLGKEKSLAQLREKREKLGSSKV